MTRSLWKTRRANGAPLLPCGAQSGNERQAGREQTSRAAARQSFDDGAPGFPQAILVGFAGKTKGIPQ